MLCYNWTTAGAISSSRGGQSITRAWLLLSTDPAVAAAPAATGAAACGGVLPKAPWRMTQGLGILIPLASHRLGLFCVQWHGSPLGAWPKVATKGDEDEGGDDSNGLDKTV